MPVEVGFFREKPEWNGVDKLAEQVCSPYREANLAWANASYVNVKH